MRNLGRWKCSTNLTDVVDGAATAEPVRARTHDSAPDRYRDAEIEAERLGGPDAVHTHIWLSPNTMAPPQPAPRQAAATRDAVAPPRRPRDQTSPGEGGLICRIGRSGADNSLVAEDANGNRLVVRKGEDGRIEVLHAANPEETDPDRIAAQTPGNHDGGALDELAVGTFTRHMGRALSPSGQAADRGPSGLRGLAEMLRVHYARKA